MAWLVHTHYESGAQWNPVETSPARALLALFDNTVVARIKPEYALSTLSNAVSDVQSIKGVGGEANEVVVKLLKNIN